MVILMSQSRDGRQYGDSDVSEQGSGRQYGDSDVSEHGWETVW